MSAAQPAAPARRGPGREGPPSAWQVPFRFSPVRRDIHKYRKRLWRDGTQTAITDLVISMSWGAEREYGTAPPEFTPPLSYEQIARETGYSRTQVVDSATDAVERGLLIRTAAGRKFCWRFDQENLDRVVAVKETGREEIPRENNKWCRAAEPEPEPEPEPLVMMPGAISRPVPLSRAVRAYEFANADPLVPLQVDQIREGSVLRFCVRRADAGQSTAVDCKPDYQSTVVDCSPPGPVLVSGRPGRQLQSTAVDCSGSPDDSLGRLRAAIGPVWRESIGKPLADDFLREIARVLGATPVLNAYLPAVQAAIDSLRAKRKPVRSGIFLFAAKEAADAWQARETDADGDDQPEIRRSADWGTLADLAAEWRGRDK